LMEGSVRVYRSHESGQEITLYFLEPGEQCNVNLNCAFTDTPAIATAVTESGISALMLPADVVKRVYAVEPAYQQYVFTLFAERLESLAGLIEDIRFKKLDQRLLDWLHEHDENPIAITHEKLASHLGTSREVVSRMLKVFEHGGIVKLHRGKIERL
jgi:CRP/FNR family transcriptional regulator